MKMFILQRDHSTDVFGYFISSDTVSISVFVGVVTPRSMTQNESIITQCFMGLLEEHLGIKFILFYNFIICAFQEFKDASVAC